MKVTRGLLRFLMASITAFGALHYLGFFYESLLLAIADRLIHGLNLGARLIHDSTGQLCIITFLPGGSAQFKISDFDWLYAAQATAVGVVLSTHAPSGRTVFWMTNVCATMALIHTTLLVLATAEISKQFNGTNGEFAAFGTIFFKLYRNAIPLLLAGVWIICSREALFAAGGVRYFKPPLEPDKRTTGSRILWIPRVFGQELHGRLPNPAACRGTHTKRFPSPATPELTLTPSQDKPNSEQG